MCLASCRFTWPTGPPADKFALFLEATSCAADYTAGPWAPCSQSCAGSSGVRQRDVYCLDGFNQRDPSGAACNRPAQYPMVATANFLKYAPAAMTEGVVTFRQDFAGGPTQIDVRIIGSVGNVGNPNQFGEWHIHDFPVDTSQGASQCEASSVGGHYNPTNIADYRLCNPNVLSTCEVGDLSGIFGPMPGSFWVNTYSHPSLDICAISGRSMVVHDSGGNRWVCATIEMTSGQCALGTTNSLPATESCVGYASCAQPGMWRASTGACSATCGKPPFVFAPSNTVVTVKPDCVSL